MKKKYIVIGVVIVAALFGVFKLKDYYTDRYVESDIFYVKVPDNQSMTIDDLFDDSGKAVDKGKEYEFTGYNIKKESRVVSFSYQTENADKLLKPGEYLKVSVSKSVVLNEEVISLSDVPTEIVSLLD